MKQPLYRLYRAIKAGKKLNPPEELGLVWVVFDIGSIRVAVEGTTDESGWPVEYWLHHTRVHFTDQGLSVYGINYAEDRETEVVEGWAMIPEGFKEVADESAD